MLHNIRVVNFSTNCELINKEEKCIASTSISKANRIHKSFIHGESNKAIKTKSSKVPLKKSKSEVVKAPVRNDFKPSISSSHEKIHRIVNYNAQKPKQRNETKTTIFSREMVSSFNTRAKCNKLDPDVHILYNREAPSDKRNITKKPSNISSLYRDVCGLERDINALKSALHKTSGNVPKKSEPKQPRSIESESFKAKQLLSPVNQKRRFNNSSICYPIDLHPRQKLTNTCPMNAIKNRNDLYPKSKRNKNVCVASAGTSKDGVEPHSSSARSDLCSSSVSRQHGLLCSPKTLYQSQHKPRVLHKLKRNRKSKNRKGRKFLAKKISINSPKATQYSMGINRFFNNVIKISSILVKNSIRYGLYGLLLIAFAPCILTVILIRKSPAKLTRVKTNNTYKHQKECYQTSYNWFWYPEENNKIEKRHKQTWCTRITGRVLKSINTILSVFKMNEKKKPPYPNPTKEYKLKYVEDRGWLMKSIRHNKRNRHQSSHHKKCKIFNGKLRHTRCNKKHAKIEIGKDLTKRYRTHAGIVEKGNSRKSISDNFSAFFQPTKRTPCTTTSQRQTINNNASFTPAANECYNQRPVIVDSCYSSYTCNERTKIYRNPKQEYHSKCLNKSTSTKCLAPDHSKSCNQFNIFSRFVRNICKFLRRPFSKEKALHEIENSQDKRYSKRTDNRTQFVYRASCSRRNAQCRTYAVKNSCCSSKCRHRSAQTKKCKCSNCINKRKVRCSSYQSNHRRQGRRPQKLFLHIPQKLSAGDVPDQRQDIKKRSKFGKFCSLKDPCEILNQPPPNLTLMAENRASFCEMFKQICTMCLYSCSMGFGMFIFCCIKSCCMGCNC